VSQINGKELDNSFEKGLLIIGDYGNGKTTIMQCFEILFKKNFEIAMTENWDTLKDWQNLRFKSSKSHDIVTEFETLMNIESKDNFYKKYSQFRYYFDDVKKEKTASNYGKTEIIKELIEKRYDKKAKTFITCNYKEGCSNDLQEALVEFGDRYGGHFYDRLFEMFNIIEFKGKSFRK
jgi:DNA replication protein DnaC